MNAPKQIVISTGAYPDFLPATQDKAECAPFRKEGRMVTHRHQVSQEIRVAEWRDPAVNSLERLR